MKVYANVAILYLGRQYKPGEQIVDFNNEMLKLWTEHGSVRTEDDVPAMQEEPTGDDVPAPTGDDVGGNPNESTGETDNVTGSQQTGTAKKKKS